MCSMCGEELKLAKKNYTTNIHTKFVYFGSILYSNNYAFVMRTVYSVYICGFQFFLALSAIRILNIYRKKRIYAKFKRQQNVRAKKTTKILKHRSGLNGNFSLASNVFFSVTLIRCYFSSPSWLYNRAHFNNFGSTMVMCEAMKKKQRTLSRKLCDCNTSNSCL